MANENPLNPGEELERLLSQHGQRLQSLLQRMLGPRASASSDDVYQEITIELWKKLENGEHFRPESFWSFLSQLARWRVIDSNRRREPTVISQVLQGEDQGLGGLEPAADVPTPSEAIREQERSVRKQKLLSEILQSYCRYCEKQSRMLVGKEIFERTLRGEPMETVVSAMGLTDAQFYSAVNRANHRMNEFLKEHDQARSVFLTLYRQQADHPLQTQKHNRKLNDTVPAIYTTSDLFRWLLDQAGAMCPAPDRLEDYAANPIADISDIHYHISIAKCPLCTAQLNAITEPTED